MQPRFPRLWLLVLAVFTFSLVGGISLASLHLGRTAGRPPAPTAPPGASGTGASDASATPPETVSLTPDPAVPPTAPAADAAASDPLRPLPRGAGKIAIIIDDMGQGLPGTADLLAIRAPLTFSFIPHTPRFDAERREVEAAGQQVFLHLPMEPLPTSFSRPIPDEISTAMTDEEIAAKVRELAATLPEARGANNHMGSKATGDSRVMTDVMTALKSLGLPFIDSRTQAKSVAYATARQVGLPTAANSLFIDRDKPVEEAGAVATPAAVRAVEERLRQAAGIAARTGSVIVIGHPRPAVAAGIAAMLPVLDEAGIKLVYASELLR